MHRVRLALLTALLLLALGSEPALAAKAPLCSGGVFVLDAAAGPLVPEGATPDRLNLSDDGLTEIASGCPETPGKLKATGKGTKLKASWTRKNGLCDGLVKKAKLKARFDASCELLTGKFKSKGLKRIFTATRAGIVMDGSVPTSLYGEPLSVGRASGAEMLGADPTWEETFTALGTNADAVEIASGGSRPGAGHVLHAVAWTAGGVDWATLLGQLVAGIAAHPTSGMVAEERLLAGRSVWKVEIPATPGAAPTYYGVDGDTLLLLASADEELVAAVLAELPTVAAAAPAVAIPRGISPIPGANPLTVRLLLPVPTPAGPVCVAEPYNPRVSVDLVAIDTAFQMPILATLGVQSALAGSTLPITSTGLPVRFEYKAESFRSVELLMILAAGSAGGLGFGNVTFPVQHCLNGTWQDGDRVLRIEQVLACEKCGPIGTGQVTASTAEGEICEGEEPGGIVFTGELDPFEVGFSGSDLKVCSPRECVDAGLREPAAYVDYDARIDGSGMRVDFDWESVQMDLVYDDDGNLIGCPANGDVQQRSFPIHRLTFDPLPW